MNTMKNTSVMSLLVLLGFGFAACNEPKKPKPPVAKPIPLVPVNGGWSEWRDQQACLEGKIKQVRSCTNPVPEHNGKTCEGKNERFRSCLFDGIVQIGDNCSGALIAPDKVLTTYKCVANQENLKVLANDGSVSIAEDIFYDKPEFKNNLVVNNYDIAIVQLADEIELEPLDLVLSKSEDFEDILSNASGLSSPLIKGGIRFIGLGGSVLENRDINEAELAHPLHEMDINFRYPLDQGMNELIFGSINRQICGKDRGGLLLHQNKVIGIASRPLLKDTTCGNHISWIFIRLSGDANKMISRYL